ncbi:ETC complex I subunit [Aureimonas flava]|uniref:ETC complex I subunit n=1 Tax=Aureimonas flava TaxID=2320271 RepID=A0A3A1WP34_9HYPH|nr:ETC complex I subunit [Aureimonas flava]RIY03657.1 ETC complex I subunit [Aureimonas flava]
METESGDGANMVARIYRPARTAMQSGKGNTREWLFLYEAEDPKTVEPLMGYTSSRDMRSQIRLSFETKELAIEYAERNGIPYRVEEQHIAGRPKVSYSDNFRYDRAQPWTH